MMPEKECYNQLLAIFLDYPEENREDFVSLLNHYESNFDFLSGVTYTGSRLAAIHDKLNFSNEVRVVALKQLIKIFDIQQKMWYFSGIVTG